MRDTGIERQLRVNLLSADLKDEPFDGEAYVEAQISQWGRQNVLFLDPFAMWRQPGDQRSRNRYGAIVHSLIRRGLDAPSLVLFWTWGRAFPIAEGDLDVAVSP